MVVGLNKDNSVDRLKGPNRPIMPFEERAKVIAGLECVDFVVGFEEDTPLEIIKTIKPDVIVKGGDYKKDQVVGNELAEVVIFPMLNSLSTTEKIKKISNLS